MQPDLEKNATITTIRVDAESEDGQWYINLWHRMNGASIYTNANDITEQENESAIAKAEVKYQQTVREIESKDKAYDNILKRLDTEHSALQTEFDSVKNVISKNIERTLKIYS